MQLIKLVLSEVGLQLTKQSEKITGVEGRRQTTLNINPAKVQVCL